MLSYLFIYIEAHSYLFSRTVRKSIERHHKLLISPENSGITSFGGSPRRVEINENGTSADVQFFSLSTIIAATGDFAFANKLGEGGFGTVYKVKLKFILIRHILLQLKKMKN